MVYLDAILKVLPVLLLLGIGYWLGRQGFFGPRTAEDLKRLVVNVALPASLFLAFSRVTLDAGLVVIPLAVFAACVLVFVVAFRLPQARSRRAFPYLMSGFEAGMMGYAIFGAAYGQENIYKFGVVDLGQVTFVFFILVPALRRLSGGVQSFRDVLISFLKTPVILAILGGILFSQSGLYARLADNPVYGSLQTALGLLGGMTTPLATLVIGSEIRLKGGQLSAPARTVLLRLLIWAQAALLLNLVVGRLLGLDPLYQAAILLMAVLPPPFVVPLFLQNAPEEETAYVVNTLSLATLATLLAFVVVTLVYPHTRL